MQTKLPSKIDFRIFSQLIENHSLKKLLTAEVVAENCFFANATSHINGIDILINSETNIKLI